jgi:hypothetical protein
MADLEPPLYILDDYALERVLAGGDDETHQTIANWKRGTLCVTRKMKDDFLDAYPEDEARMSTFAIVRKCEVDNRIAGTLADNLQNLPDIDSREVKKKIYLLAMAWRLGATVVTAENIGVTTWIKALADGLAMDCISVEEFLASA